MWSLLLYDLLPGYNKDQEIEIIDSQSYVTVCNNNGKLVVKCDELHVDNERYLVIYKNEYKFIDPKDYTFKTKTYDYIDTVDTWHKPANDKDGKLKVSVTFKMNSLGKYHYKTDCSDCYHVNITNNDDKELVIGETFKLEKAIYGKWRTISPDLPVCETDCIHKLSKGQSAGFVFDFSPYGDLEPGLYRIAIGDCGKCTNFYYAEFRINDEGEFEIVK